MVVQEQPIEDLVYEIRRLRLKRFFSLSDEQIDELSSSHESMISTLYEIYRRYGDQMDDRMKSAVAIHLLSDADFALVYNSLDEKAANKIEVMCRFKFLRKSNNMPN